MQAEIDVNDGTERAGTISGIRRPFVSLGIPHYVLLAEITDADLLVDIYVIQA